MSVYQFLERVEELAKARHASKIDLYASAIALFEDKALLWFRSVRSRISDWDALITALKQEFLPPDYDDILWDEIKARVQGKSETITIFVAVMETLFSRLTRPPVETTKVKVIRKNLLPHYLMHLSLVDVKTVQELLVQCKKIEEMNAMRNRFKSGVTSF
ncbi:hypothetical protein Zmor_006002 [Zophobas morio]|uniref:Retrotransposon gag domain-containing protein n=1 Tax=Zophobas morio TaxID=2755281 RepID=A0AA38MMJ9_9CUCU|nr:hypothetical protein Zmor_006002 [Zophobas morio]